jgi:hypothetical protein
MAVLIKDIIPQLVSYNADWRIALLAQWQAIVGKLKTRIRLEKVYEDTLVIGVYESHWMQELYLLSSVLIDSINTFLGEPRIKHLRFKLVEEKKRITRGKKRATFVKQAVLSLTEGQQSAIAHIEDEHLKKALIDFWSRCAGRFHE